MQTAASQRLTFTIGSMQPATQAFSLVVSIGALLAALEGSSMDAPARTVEPLN